MLLIHEQGLGDSIHFIRYAPLLKARGATVFFECPPRLAKLLERTPGIDKIIPIGQERPEHDVHVPLMTLPGLMGTSLESLPVNIPYIEPPSELVEHWRRELAVYPEFKVGINWQGNPGYAGDFHRSMALRFFAPLAKVPGIRLFSLQKNDGLSQLQQLGDAFSVVDLGTQLDEVNGPFMDTAAVMKNLDLFVTSDTAVAHLAGALGVPVWVVLSKAPGWQWMFGREDSPWYPTMRLFRQERLLDWPPVFERIAQELTKVIPPSLRARSIGVRVSPGELFERIARAEIDLELAPDEMSRRACQTDLAQLKEIRDRTFPSTSQLEALAGELRGAISTVQTAEETLRACEKAGDFGAAFVEQARALAGARERWGQLRREIDSLLLASAEKAV